MSAITRFLPKNHLSYIVGLLVHLKLPAFLNNVIIANFAKAYRIRLDEAEFTIDKYPSLGEFFIRRLKPGIRPIAVSWAVHPADSVITQFSIIQNGKLIQAKNKTYSVLEFTKDQNALAKWDQGIFVTYYLCPTDYHRVHSPVNGIIKKVRHIPGALWPVNNWSTENIQELFSVNERVLVEIETDRGLVGVMFVGATNVGQIILAFDSEIVGNQLLSSAIHEKLYSLPIQRGEELGAFRMGSTIVMLYPKDALKDISVNKYLNQQVQVNAELC
ncbi:MAG: archaetidylserine decarboxylase [Pseudobdellovibrio sp.]